MLLLSMLPLLSIFLLFLPLLLSYYKPSQPANQSINQPTKLQYINYAEEYTLHVVRPTRAPSSA